MEDDYLYPNQMACPRIARDYNSWLDNEVEFWKEEICFQLTFKFKNFVKNICFWRLANKEKYKFQCNLLKIIVY